MTRYVNFNQLIENVSKRLKPFNFRQKSTMFYRLAGDGNQQIVSFQLSQRSSITETIFTVNLGIHLAKLTPYFPMRAPSASLDGCHWAQRLGFLLPEQEDTWWRITPETDVQELAMALLEAIFEIALPTLERYSRDEELRDLWLSGKSPSLTDVQRLMYLVALLAEIGPHAQVATVASELQQKTAGEPIGVVARNVLRKLPPELVGASDYSNVSDADKPPRL